MVLGVLVVVPSFAQPLNEQFEVRLAGEEFGRVCPAFEIPIIAVEHGESVSFDITIQATGSIALKSGVILPSGATSSLGEIGAFLSPQLPTVLPAGSEAFSLVQWTPLPVHQGSYQFRFVASVTTEFGYAFSVCDVPVEVISEGAGETCTLTNVLDGFDGDSQINFGNVDVGSSASGLALLDFSIPISSAADDGQILHCLPDGLGVSVSPGELVGDFLVVDLAYTPTNPGTLASEVSFYHISDANGQDLCDSDVGSANPCIRHLQLSGRGTESVVSLAFENEVCGEIPTNDVVLRNETAEDLLGLSVEIGAPFEISPLGAFSVDNISLGPSGTAAAERKLRISYPTNPDEQVGGVLSVHSSDARLIQTVLPAPSCVSVFPLSIDFGETAVETTGVRTLLITNNTAEDAVISLSVMPSDNGFVTITSTLSVEPNASQELEVQFLASRLGRSNAELRLESEGLEDIPSVSLSGTGVQNPNLILSFYSAGLRLSPGSSLVFPDTDLNATSVRALQITNEGNTTARGLQLLSANDAFAVTSPGALDLEPRSSHDFVLAFRPRHIGTSTAELRINGSNFEEQTFLLQGGGVLGQVTAIATGLAVSVPPLQSNPYPSVGLELTVPAPEPLVGTLNVTLDPDGAALDPSVRFLATGPSIPFRIDVGSTEGHFVGEPDPRRARYQSGTVAGLIQFRVSDLATTAGTVVDVAGRGEIGSTKVSELEPMIVDSVQCRLTSDGIEVSVQALSTIREINGVALNVTAAPDTTLNFVSPPEDFANSLFSAWFSDPSHDRYGGVFRLSVPISFTDLRTFGSGSIRLRNSVGWSEATIFESNSCR